MRSDYGVYQFKKTTKFIYVFITVLPNKIKILFYDM